MGKESARSDGQWQDYRRDCSFSLRCQDGVTDGSFDFDPRDRNLEEGGITEEELSCTQTCLVRERY
jgi:hypothetical protein